MGECFRVNPFAGMIRLLLGESRFPSSVATRKDRTMLRFRDRWWLFPVFGAVAAAGLALPSRVNAACCYFSAKDADILQPAQKVFLTWDPVKKVESFTVQPK